MQKYLVKKHEWHWDFIRDDAAKASFSKMTKNELLAAAEAFMAGKTGAVHIHRADGSFERERVYPRKPAPKKPGT